jgi:hypothetical protein
MAFAAVAAGIGAVGAIGSAVGGISASNAAGRAGKNARKLANEQAAKTLAETQRAQALQQQQYNQNKDIQYAINQENKAYMEPYRQAGITGQNRLLTLMGLNGGNAGAADYGRYAKDFQMSDFQQDPGYAFRLAEGMKAMNAAAAARGGLMSGGALKAGQQYGQDMGSQEYQNAYQRYQTNRANQLAPLGALTSAGQNAAQNTSATNALYGGQMGDASRAYANTQNELGLGGQARASGYLTGGQEAQAAGRMGGQSAMNTGFSNAGSSLQNALLMNRLFPSERAGNAPFQGGFADALPAISNVNQYMPSWVSGRQ